MDISTLVMGTYPLNINSFMSNHESQEGRIRDIVFGTPAGKRNSHLEPSLFILVDLKRNSRVVKLTSYTGKSLIQAFGTKLSFWLGKRIMHSTRIDTEGKEKICVFPVNH